MKHFEEKELDRIMRLSGLSLSEEERELLFSDLSRIVPYIERIAELGEEKEPENSFPESLGKALLREDEEEESNLSEEILSSAPARLESTFTVPRTVE